MDRGRPVDAWAAGERDSAEFPWPSLDVVLQICDAVSHAHHHGVLHRDLKPSNIMVDDSGHAVVLDFGVAGFLAEQGRGLTRTAEFVGTPIYAAPERLSAGAIPDTRGDVYSLGVLLYEVLTGKLPWQTDGRLADALRRIRTEDPDPVSRHDRRLGRDLDSIVRMALARSPDERYQSVDALADDLVRYREGHAVAAAQTGGPWRRAVSFARRHRVAVGAAALSILAVLAFGAVFGERARQLGDQRLAAQGHREAADRASTLLARTLDRFDMLTSLSAVRRAAQLGTELQRQPPTPEHAPAMRTWLEERAQPLMAQFATLEAALADLNTRSLDWTEDLAREYADQRERLREAVEAHALVIANAGPFGRQLWRAWDDHERIEAQRAELAAKFAVRFESEEDQYIHDVLAELLAEL